MTRHRSPGGQENAPAQQHDSDEESTPDRTRKHRVPTPSSVLRGRIVVAAVAAGAFAAAGQAMAAEQDQSDSQQDDSTPLASSQEAAASLGTATEENSTGTKGSDGASTGVGGAAPSPEVLPVARTANTDDEVRKIAKSQRVERAREAAIREAQQPDYVSPAEGTFTSGFGGRWGTTHYGIDIANGKGTQISSVAEGTVLEAGPASGFGLWVRVQHTDGTITVYGHLHSITVQEGEKVEAGDQIATMGNRGFSTGTHLHFEVWNQGGKKINPLPWLNDRGVSLT